MNRFIRSYLSKLNFLAGRSPVIKRSECWEDFIPRGYKSVITITADFELAWAWRFSKSNDGNLSRALEKARLERKNVPKILELCETYQIPITWATVGHLMLESCKIERGIIHDDMPRLHNFENQYWIFNDEDWYCHDPCSDYVNAPEWYCPDLIKAILDSNISHEIGCHTFSHIDCSEEICPKSVFDAEIAKCTEIVRGFELTMRSFVHPGHTIGHVKELEKHGFTSFQTDPGNILGYPIKHTDRLWELQRTYEFTYRSEWSIAYHIKRLRKIIDRAIKSNTVCNFWFHPSLDTVFIEDIMGQVFRHMYERKDDVKLMTCGEYCNYLNER